MLFVNCAIELLYAFFVFGCSILKISILFIWLDKSLLYLLIILIILFLSRILDISTSSSLILIQIGMVKQALFLSKTSLFKSNLLDLIGLSFLLFFVIFSSSSINCPSCANTFKAAFL